MLRNHAEFWPHRDVLRESSICARRCLMILFPVVGGIGESAPPGLRAPIPHARASTRPHVWLISAGLNISPWPDPTSSG